MATYNKPLKTIMINFMVASVSAVTVTDTATNPAASNALAEFEAYKTMHIPQTNGGTLLIPFHAVAMITVTTENSEVTKADPYGCEDTSTDDDNGSDI